MNDEETLHLPSPKFQLFLLKKALDIWRSYLTEPVGFQVTCPLCQELDCAECPIGQEGFTGCEGSPFYKIHDYRNHPGPYRMHEKMYYAAVQEEITFLEGILENFLAKHPELKETP